MQIKKELCYRRMPLNAANYYCALTFARAMIITIKITVIINENNRTFIYIYNRNRPRYLGVENLWLVNWCLLTCRAGRSKDTQLWPLHNCLYNCDVNRRMRLRLRTVECAQILIHWTIKLQTHVLQIDINTHAHTHTHTIQLSVHKSENKQISIKINIDWKSIFLLCKCVGVCK